MKTTCSCCCAAHVAMDRRRFLANATKAACGLGLAFAGLPEVFASEEVRRPRPEVTVRAVFVRPPGKYWLGWPGTSYDVEGHRRDYTTQLIESGRRVGVNVIPNLEPLYSDQDVDKFVAQLKQTRPDGVVVTLLHIGQWPWVQKIAAAGIPTIVFSPIGTSFTGHVVGFSRQPGVYVVSSLELAAVEYGLKMIQTASYLKQCRVLLIRGAERSDSVIDRLGINVRAIPRRAFSDLYDQMPLTDEVRDIAADYGRRARKIVEPTAQDRLNAAKVYTTARKLLAQENATSLAMDCLGMVADRQVPTPPCMAWSKLNDEGITAACEADLFAAVSLMLVSHLFDQPGFMQDPVAETAQNLLVAAHCTCATKLNGFDKPSVPFILRSHSESDIGVSMQVLWEEGRKVTLVRFTGPDQVIVDSGTIVGNVQTPPAGGCRTSLEIRMDDVADARDVKGFHQVVFYGDHGKQVRDYCQLYGIQAISSA